MSESTLAKFSISLCGALEPYSPTISKGRCRIFYKYGNRNGTYITDEYADKLLATLPYTPVKGIYDAENGDYTDHGKERTEGRIYGVVPSDPNVSWEDHEDEDGVVRTYACTDVLLYTGLYDEAKQILGKAQSMELYCDTVKGEWRVIDGKKYYVFTDGCFLGLQALGDKVEPCFEGAAFFNLFNELKDFVDKLEYSYNAQNESNGGIKMELNFKLSDNQKAKALWNLLNPSYNADNGWVVNCGICEIYSDYVLCVDYENDEYFRAYYTKNDEDDSVVINKKCKCYMLDVTEDEKTALETLRKLNNDTYTALDQKFTDYENLAAKNSELDAQIVELNNNLSTLNMERSQAQTEYAQLNEANEALKTQFNALTEHCAELETSCNELAAYKKNIEDTAKTNLIMTYSEQLPNETIQSYLDNVSKYDLCDLDMKLTYEVKKANPDVFSKNKIPAYVFTDTNNSVAGLEGILAKYENK